MVRKVFRFVAMLLLVFASAPCSAVTLTADSLARRIAWQQWVFPQEKVYVMTDRDGYMSGDTVRFRAFLVDAMTHVPVSTGSRFVYVELLNPFGETAERVKIRQRDGVFAGMIPLPEEMSEGQYTLCAYTNFMKNGGEDYFFRKPLPVRSYLSKKYSLQTEIDGDHMIARLTEKGSNRAVRAEYLAVVGPGKEVLVDNLRKRSSLSLRLTDDLRSMGALKVKFDRYEKFVTLPTDADSLAVTFHPEGGYLIADRSNLLAFKALQSNGLSVEVAGKIVDSKGDSIAPLRSTHRGMGAIAFTPSAGESYRGIVGGREFPLPAAESRATVIHVDNPSDGADLLRLTVRGPIPAGASLLAHNCGRVTFAAPLDSGAVELPRAPLGSGIVQLLLADAEGRILSSRMVFNHTDYLYNAPLDSIPPGDYAVRLFNPDRLSADTTRSIVSNLLLTSELRGHIEDPDYYFRSTDSLRHSNLDLLMLTQGWQRYDLPSALRGDYARPTEPVEIGGEITGLVRSRWRAKPLAGANVVVMAPSIGYGTGCVTDSLGRFVINGVDWPDGTLFALQVYGRNGSREHNFEVDPETFPPITPLRFAPESGEADEEPIFSPAGSILLHEIEVTAPRNSEEARREMFKALGVRAITADDIADKHFTSYEQAIRTIPGLRIHNGNVVSNASRGSLWSSGGGHIPVELWVDGTKWEPPYGSGAGGIVFRNDPNLIGGDQSTFGVSRGSSNTLYEFEAMYPIEMVESIEYFKPSMAMFISLAAANGAGALVVNTKDGAKGQNWDHGLFIKTILPLGYQSSPEVYRPHFVYDETSDTKDAVNLGWYPSVNDIKTVGEARGCRLLLEGITEYYQPIRALIPKH